MGSGFVKVAARRKTKVKNKKKTKVEVNPSRRRVIAFPCKSSFANDYGAR
jgi:hypothetical protein